MLNTGQIVEIIGPAGAGKTTLLRALQRAPIKIISEIPLSKMSCAGTMLRHTALFIPALFSPKYCGRWFTSRESRSMVYLHEWREWLSQQCLNDAAVIFDHGPVYRLALLREFGPMLTGSFRFKTWWESQLRQWASWLNLVIWLDAPDEVLLQRINKRADLHQMKGKPESQVLHFLTRYRSSYELTMRRIQLHRQLRILRFDTTREDVRDIAKSVLLTSEMEAVTC